MKSPVVEGMDALRAGQRAQAVEFFKLAIAETPNDPLVWMGMASAVDEIDRKRFCYQKVLELDPANPHALRALEKLDATPELIPTLISQPAPASAPASASETNPQPESQSEADATARRLQAYFEQKTAPRASQPADEPEKAEEQIQPELEFNFEHLPTEPEEEPAPVRHSAAIRPISRQPGTKSRKVFREAIAEAQHSRDMVKITNLAITLTVLLCLATIGLMIYWSM